MDLILDVNTQIYPVDLGKVLDVWCILSGYHADTPITIKAEAIHEADSHIH